MASQDLTPEAQKTGRPAPRDVRMSRGYTVRVGDMRVSVADAAALVHVQ